MKSISVVISLYNKEPHVARALGSILSQTAPAQEIIVIDDGSTDRGGEVVKEFTDPRIRLIRQENQGVSAARNRGVEEAKGELIAFLDADDAWRPRFLEVIHHLQKKFPQAGAFATCFSVVNKQGQFEEWYSQVVGKTYQEGLVKNYLRAATSCRVLWFSAAAVPKKVMQEIGGFPVGETYCEDADTALRIALRYPIAWSPERLVIYYQDAVNRSKFGFIDEPAVSRTARKAMELGLIPSDQLEDLREYAAHFQMAGAKECLRIGKKKAARRFLRYVRGCRKYTRERIVWEVISLFPGNTGLWLWDQWLRIKKMRIIEN